MTENVPEEFAPEAAADQPIEVGGRYDPAAPQPGAPTEAELEQDTNLFPPTGN